jgi:membrane-associated phospholipid phosphatase
MENIFQIGMQIIVWLQSLNSWLTPVMKVFTFLGSTEFYLVVAPALLWCVDAVLGVRLGLYLMINALVNATFKIIFHGPRPYWYTENVKVLGGSENSFGAPSGHAQNAVVVWGTLADRIKTRAAWIIAILIMFMIGISRMYLAVHFPHDVLLGWLFGSIMLWILLHFEKPVVNWLKQYSTGKQVLLSFLFSLLMLLVVIIANLSISGWSVPPIWITNAHLAFPNDPTINPLSLRNTTMAAGAFFGLAAGWLWLSKLGGFLTKAAWYKLILRYVLGIIGVLILYLGIGYLLPQTETVLSSALRYAQFSLIGFWMSGLAPWFFIKIKLASPLK